MTDPSPDPLIQHVDDELARVGVSDALRAAVLDTAEKFVSLQMSADDAVNTIKMVVDLLRFRNLTPLTDDPAEWKQIAPNTWQSTRNVDAFSSDGGVTYKLLSEGFMIHNSDHWVAPPPDPAPTPTPTPDPTPTLSA